MIKDFLRFVIAGAEVLVKQGWMAFFTQGVNWFKQRDLLKKQIACSPAAAGVDVPSSELGAFVGGGDYISTGKEFLDYFVNLCGLKPHEAVLDVGCGIGRMAVPLTGYLDSEGSYEGFDVVKAGIDWCNCNISSKYPNFHFQLAEIHNKAYNPAAKVKAMDFRFPYADNSFDLVFLTSVFTHMLTEDVEHYLDEIGRVLKSGGRCLITWFLLNQESEAQIKKGKSTLNFKYGRDICRYETWQTPESAVAYREGYIFSLYGSRQLGIVDPVYYGSWCGRSSRIMQKGEDKERAYQDMIIARKI